MQSGIIKAEVLREGKWQKLSWSDRSSDDKYLLGAITDIKFNFEPAEKARVFYNDKLVYEGVPEPIS